MFGPSVEEEFINAAEARPARGAGRGAALLLALLVGGLGAFLLWAARYEIEETARGLGRVVPSARVQVVQSPEAGIVAAIHVREGEVVDAGAPLIQIDDTAAGSQAGELLEREAALLAERARVTAEAEGAGALAIPADLAARAPVAVAAEQAVFLSRRGQLETELAVLDDKLAQARADLGEARAVVSKLEGQIAPLTEEAALTGEYVKSGAVPRIELLRLQSRLAEVQGELEVARARLPKIEARIGEAETQIAAARSAYVLTARERLARIEGELAVLAEALRAARDRVTRTTLRAPVRGTVNTLAISTVGAVVSPGMALVEIVPADESLRVEARISPRDVAFVKPGDPASVKITAYDYVVYGALDGAVDRVGADAIEDETGNAWFQVTIRTATTKLGRDESLPISPGMVAQVDIQTGRKTVLDYLLNPFLRARREALRER